MNTAKEIARVTLGGFAFDVICALQTAAKLGQRVEACVTEDSAVVVFKPLEPQTETIELRVDTNDFKRAIGELTIDLEAESAALKAAAASATKPKRSRKPRK